MSTIALAMETSNTLSRAIARYYPFMPFRRRLPWLNGSPEAIPREEIVGTREGLRVRVDQDGMYHDIYYWRDYEPYHTKIYRRIVRSGDVVLDVGANFGWFTALFAQWIGPSGHVHSFEPVPFIHALAADTIALNGLDARVTLNNIGLGQHNGSLSIFTFAGLPHGHATAADLGRSDAISHTCQIHRLDDYCEENQLTSIRLMKVDVEGFEADVFLGAERLLSARDAPIIGFEINGNVLKRRSLTGADTIAPLREFGYTDFFAFSTRTGVKRLTSDNIWDKDCLASKPERMHELGPALRAGRLLR